MSESSGPTNRSGRSGYGPLKEDGPAITPEISGSSVNWPVRQTVGFVLIIVLLGACDTSVQPIIPSDERHYSIFGVVNPAQDTQWVRVEPLGPATTGGAPSTLDVTVTLKNMSSGQTWSLRDSVMEVFAGERQHNFWTKAPIQPSTPYRLTVENGEGDSSWAETTTPSSPPTVTPEGPIRLPCLDVESANTFDVRIEDLEELAALKVRYFQTFMGIQSTYVFDSYDDAVRREGAYRASINYREDLETTNQTIGRECIADSAHVTAASGGPDWPEWARYNDATISELARPDSFSNVQKGHGMFSGVYTAKETVETTERNPG